jgi:hypothetical protein
MINSNHITLEAFATQYHYSIRYLRNIVAQGKIPGAFKLMGRWFVDTEKNRAAREYPQPEKITIPESEVNVLEIRDRVIAEMGIPPVRRGRHA